MSMNMKKKLKTALRKPNPKANLLTTERAHIRGYALCFFIVLRSAYREAVSQAAYRDEVARI